MGGGRASPRTGAIRKDGPSPATMRIRSRILRDLLDVQQEIKNPREFMSNLKVALFPEEVYVFTPNGDVKSFPKGATPIDFAYSIHTDIGNKCIGAKVNRNIVPLKYQLQERGYGRDHHPVGTPSQQRLAEVCGHLPGDGQDPELGQDRRAGKERGSRKGPPGEGIQEASPEVWKFRQSPRKWTASLPSAMSIPLEDLMAVVGYGRVSPKHVVHHFLPRRRSGRKRPSRKRSKKGRKASPSAFL